MTRTSMKINKWWPRLAILLAAMTVAGGLAACGSSKPDNKSAAAGGSAKGSDGKASSLKGKSVAFTTPTGAAPSFVDMTNGVKRAAAATGVDLTVYDNRADPATILNNAKLIATQKPDIAIEWNPVKGIWKSVAATYERAGVSCIAANVPSTGACPYFNLSNPVVCGDTAKAMGKIAAGKGWNGSNTKVILVNAASFGDEVNSCIGDYYVELQKLVPGLAQIGKPSDITPSTSTVGKTTYQVDGKAVRGASFDVVTKLLQAIPSKDNIILYTVLDDSTLGAWQAIQRAGRAKTSITAGLGSNQEALKQLRTNPQWVAQGDIFFNFWGQYMMAMVAALDGGAKPPSQTSAPVAVLTKDLSIPGTSVVPMSTYYHDGELTPYRLPPLEPVHTGPTTLGEGTIGNDYLADTGVLQTFHNVAGTGAPALDK